MFPAPPRPEWTVVPTTGRIDLAREEEREAEAGATVLFVIVARRGGSRSDAELIAPALLPLDSSSPTFPTSHISLHVSESRLEKAE
jgi:hypothetical protein